MPLLLQSTITCPHCGFAQVETMPTDACRWFHECASCHALLEPLPGDCCVFCSHGSVRCPPMQQGAGCCGGGSGA
ncbi:MAG TPA: GDCCVxC domain-containing (seleno)protein [Xanthomonadaceae bacterium]|nr:GDCCVxC domain-containing (seleno)protein [Xanthomonadaceae bacterium]